MLLRDLRQCVRFVCRLRIIFTVVFCWFAGTASSWAGGPRWVTGPPYFTTAGGPVLLYTNQPLYFTDPGSLSSSANHAAADALVAAPARACDGPTRRLALAPCG